LTYPVLLNLLSGDHEQPVWYTCTTVNDSTICLGAESNCCHLESELKCLNVQLYACTLYRKYPMNSGSFKGSFRATVDELRSYM